MGRRTEYQYDGWNRQTHIILPEAVPGQSRTTITAYDTAGNVTGPEKKGPPSFSMCRKGAARKGAIQCLPNRREEIAWIGATIAANASERCCSDGWELLGG
jgi:hypothetical protein